METDLRACRVRVTEPVGPAFDEQLVSLTPCDDAGLPTGPALDPADVAVPAPLRAHAQQRVVALFAPQYGTYVAGPSARSLECVYEAASPLVTAEVELRGEVVVAHEGARYRVAARSRVVRKYYDGVLDVVDVRG